ncbi:hypothetical protein GCK72_004185 [Caenorhabditis remanei]|uniref:Uncharacterized protein n=1 Tax=Caenorhabditis remanei TaxID=31234 RepID=A0A6A5H920_CAERE|nr:hypothetical protein GCK72_004185 [Caenorhabditis remanei]KAF1764238.1 hypothetical protein GCK72_004185 [Caenorhabditis remanei]
MFPFITILISLIYVFTIGEAGYRNNNSYYQYPTNRGYQNRGYYRTQPQYNYNNYKGYGNHYNNYQRQYQGYGNNYNNYYAQPAPAAPPRFQPSLAELLFGGMRQQPSYSSGGINYDSYGNSFVGTKENGLYLFCNGKGCPGRG